ncbi:MAG: class I SAM-dependent methyltransferase, partial [Thermoplasmata archaeon]|nr:class I SAM-dependent methyltransferase [Thermoplasmata archaeon]
ANGICWRELRREPLELLGPEPVKALDLGGGSGDFSSIIYRKSGRNLVVSVDLDIQALKNAAEGVNPVNGNLLGLPFKSGSFDLVVGRAVLHHIPDDLERGISEIERVLKDGGFVVVQEPCDGNVFANMARSIFVTEIHEEGERPLDRRALLKAISEHLKLRWAKYHFFFSYLMPHMTSRLAVIRRAMVSLTRLLVDVDKGLMKYRIFKKRAAYTSLAAWKPMKK